MPARFFLRRAPQQMLRTHRSLEATFDVTIELNFNQDTPIIGCVPIIIMYNRSFLFFLNFDF
jgi:hypothetical protein